MSGAPNSAGRAQQENWDFSTTSTATCRFFDGRKSQVRLATVSDRTGDEITLEEVERIAI